MLIPVIPLPEKSQKECSLCHFYLCQIKLLSLLIRFAFIEVQRLWRRIRPSEEDQAPSARFETNK